MTDEPTILRTPVAAVVQTVRPPRKVEGFVRVFSWLTAAFLAAAIVLALVTGAIERDNLRTEISRQSTELVCRTLAASIVTDANTARDNTIAAAVVAVANGNDEKARTLLILLDTQTEAVNAAIEESKTALEHCSNPESTS